MTDGIWIPKEFWDLDLPPLHRVLLARVFALSQKEGACKAGDDYLAESLRCTPQHIRKMRRQLQDAGYLIVEGYGHKRKMRAEVAPTGTSNQRNKQPQAQELQPQAQKLQPQLRIEATTVAQSIEYSKEESKELVKSAPKKKKEEVVMPWETEAFRAAWTQWKDYKKSQFRFTFKSNSTEQVSLHQLKTISNNDERTAIDIIGQSIGNGWKGFFTLKNGGRNRQDAKLDANKALEWANK